MTVRFREQRANLDFRTNVWQKHGISRLSRTTCEVILPSLVSMGHREPICTVTMREDDRRMPMVVCELCTHRLMLHPPSCALLLSLLTANPGEAYGYHRPFVQPMQSLSAAVCVTWGIMMRHRWKSKKLSERRGKGTARSLQNANKEVHLLGGSGREFHSFGPKIEKERPPMQAKQNLSTVHKARFQDLNMHVCWYSATRSYIYRRLLQLRFWRWSTGLWIECALKP